ncbi:hypothetical protein [Planotetraspora phitsanulokensis]|uniref:hypothetical protein n=1 Tax=Planotetraspora phitsanulokensis TaxID=575192 RepID=UPI00194DC821|nr:hypothetical protein [Planotetraspora phitsanulokensis]
MRVRAGTMSADLETGARRSFGLRLPAALLACVAVPVGLITLPWAVFVIVVFVGQISQGDDGAWSGLMAMGLPPLIGYPAAAVLWSHSRRAATRRRAWVLALLGVIAIVAVSFLPVFALGYGFYDEWRETQPGGRGYHP